MSGESRSEPVRVLIGVGANIAPEQNIVDALDALAVQEMITGVSRFYRTPAIDRPDEPDFLNGVVRIETTRSPQALKFDVLRVIEDKLGRTREPDPFASRTIDLDILAFGELVVVEEGLCIPDPDLRTRPFLAAGVLELEPTFRMPDDGASLPGSNEAIALVEAVEFSRAMKARYTQ